MYIRIFFQKLIRFANEREKREKRHGLVKMLHGELEMQWKGWDHGRVEKAPREQAAMMTMMCACVPVGAWHTSRPGSATSPPAAFHARPGGPHASCPASPATWRAHWASFHMGTCGWTPPVPIRYLRRQKKSFSGPFLLSVRRLAGLRSTY